jgi:hypothetical protein
MNEMLLALVGMAVALAVFTVAFVLPVLTFLRASRAIREA